MSAPPVEEPRSAGADDGAQEHVAGQAGVRRRDVSHVARSGALQILAALGQGLLPVYQILVARLFGAAAQGVYAYFLTWIELLARGGMMGSDKGLLRYVAAHRAEGEADKVGQALAAALRLGGSIALVLVCVSLVAAEPIARLTGFGQAAFVVRAMAPTILVFVCMIALVAATLGARTSRVHLLVRGIAEPTLLIVGALLAWSLGTGLQGLAVAHTLVFAVLAGLALLGARRVLGKAVLRKAASGPGLPGFRRFAIPLGISEMTNTVLQKADIIILGAFVDASSVAFYFGAEQLSRSVAGVRYAFDGVAAPLLSEAIHQKDKPRLQYNLRLLTRWVSLAAAPIGAVALALRPELLSLFGPEHHTAATALGLLLLAQSTNSIIGLTPHALVMSGRSDLFMWTNFGAALTNVTLNLLLIPRLGLTGAALASLCSVVGLQLALAIETWIVVRVHPLSLGLCKSLGAAALVFGFAMLVKTQLALPTAVMIGVILLGGAVIYGLTLWALGLEPEDRELLRKLGRRLARRSDGPRP